jgi:pyruvate dehydrogenase E1 component alpha subunit
MARDSFEGFDVELCVSASAAAVDFARSGQGPVMLEIVTYRHRGHSMSDPAKYRPAGELEQSKQEVSTRSSSPSAACAKTSASLTLISTH